MAQLCRLPHERNMPGQPASTAYHGDMSEAKAIEHQTEEARAWQNQEVRRRIVERTAGQPGHRDASQAEIDDELDAGLAELDRQQATLE